MQYCLKVRTAKSNLNKKIKFSIQLNKLRVIFHKCMSEYIV